MQEAQLIKYDAKNPIIKLTTAPAKPVGDHDLLVETKVAAITTPWTTSWLTGT